ncbi:MAG: cation transporter [Pseudomonadota bacterium]|nr:cation transporter [Pseudomonadota bacterium]
MASCCDNNCAIEALQERQRITLIKVLWINAVMFIVIVSAAFYSKSTALFTDGLDNLGDALTYGLSFYVVAKSRAKKAQVALFKGGLIFLAACLVIAQVIYRLVTPVLPLYEVMSIFSIAGLVANGLCLYLLWRHRHEDINMSSVYECSRNDIATNLSVILAAVGVWLFNSGLPDIVIGGLLAVLLLNSSARVIKEALSEMAQSKQSKGEII